MKVKNTCNFCVRPQEGMRDAVVCWGVLNKTKLGMLRSPFTPPTLVMNEPRG